MINDYRLYFLEQAGWSKNEVDSLELDDLIEIMEYKQRKLEKEREEKLIQGTEAVFGAISSSSKKG